MAAAELSGAALAFVDAGVAGAITFVDAGVAAGPAAGSDRGMAAAELSGAVLTP